MLLVNFSEIPLLPNDVSVKDILEILSQGNIIVCRFQDSQYPEICFKDDDHYIYICYNPDKQLKATDLLTLDSMTCRLQLFNEMRYKFYVIEVNTLLYVSVKAHIPTVSESVGGVESKEKERKTELKQCLMM